MGELELIAELGSEEAFTSLAARCARALHAAHAWPLAVGLGGDLGSGKTTWARAMLRGLGYRGRVPSPTYTLLEQYTCDGLMVVHLDLYRLRGDEELEHLGLRDWLAETRRWLLVEWPERAPQLAGSCDLLLEFSVTAADGRAVAGRAATSHGIEALRLIRQEASSNAS
jgi:tRNA threonylcarbamoyladenosine biosynthesis protein TsaE